MARQYSNFKSYLCSIQYIVNTSEAEFIATKKITYICPDNHSTTLSSAAFVNKKAACKNDPKLLCTGCKKSKDNIIKFEEEKKIIADICGHILISLEGRDNAVYICNNCGTQNKTWLCNLKSNKGHCPSCQNEEFKNKDTDVEKRLDKFGLKLVKYTDCKNILAICTCGKEYETSLFDVERGRLCINCKQDRSKKTNLEKYGVENPFQSVEIKDKIKQTNLKKYGVNHHMKNKDILEKAKKTNKDKYGVEFVFLTKEAVRKGRETMMKKYGAEFPLQSEFIMAKIRQTFLDTIGNAQLILN